MLDRAPRLLLRLEGAALFGAAIAVYVALDLSALAFVVLFLAPDVSFAAYAAGPRVGAAAYDAVHTSIGPVVLGAAGVLADDATVVQIALIWLAHIGTDRALGYGLKYPSGFNDTHLSRV